MPSNPTKQGDTHPDRYDHPGNLPKIRDDLVSSRSESQGQMFVIIKDPRTGRYFRVREPEFWLINQFNGKRSADQIAVLFADKFNMELPATAIEKFAQKLDSLFFLDTDRAEYESNRAIHNTQDNENRSTLSKILFLKLVSFDPTSFLDSMLKVYRPIHGKLLFGLSWLFMLYGLGVMWNNIGAFAHGLADIFSLGSIFTAMIALAIVIFLHELAHAITCRIHGGQVTEVGFLLLYFEPCFFTNLSDAWLFSEKKHRLAVIWAGPFMQMLTLAAVVLLWRITVVGSAINQIAQISAIVSLVTILFNFNPLIKLDGYYLLSDWLEIPNLRRKAFKYFGSRAKQALFGIEDDSFNPEEYTPRERKILMRYAIASVLYSAILLGYIGFIAGSWLIETFGLAGALVLIATPLYILRKELVASIRYLSNPMKVTKNIFSSPLRSISYILFGIVVVVVVFFVPFKERVSGTVELLPIQRFAISAGSGGQVFTEMRICGDKPDLKTGYLNMSSFDLSALSISKRVSAGEIVSAGDTLLALQSNQVTSELEVARSALTTLEAQLALLKSPPKAESLMVLVADAQAYESEFERATSELSRKRELYSKHLIAKNELEDAESAVGISASKWNSAKSVVELHKSPPKPEQEAVINSDIIQQQARIKFLESQVSAQVITSPFDGKVVEGAGESEFLVVIDESQIEARIHVSDFDLTKVSLGQNVSLRVRSYSSETFEGRVNRISQVGFRQEIQNTANTGEFVVAAIYQNTEGKLRPGMSGYAKIDIGEKNAFNLIAQKVRSFIRVEFWSLW